MKRILALSKRNVLETVREPLAAVFCLIFPLAMLVLMEIIFGGDSNAPDMFSIENYSCGIATFGFSFTMLFIALYVSSDRTNLFLSRVFVSPVRPAEYFASYILSSLPICIFQIVIVFAVSLIFGLCITVNLLLAILCLIPSMLLYISLGLLIGTLVVNEKQAGPLCSIFVSASGILGGVWFPVETVGGGFLDVCKALPFYNGVECAKNAIVGENVGVPMLITLAYAVVIFIIGLIIFVRRSKN